MTDKSRLMKDRESNLKSPISDQAAYILLFFQDVSVVISVQNAVHLLGGSHSV